MNHIMPQKTASGNEKFKWRRLESSKFQAPSSREIPSFKLQSVADISLKFGD